MSLVLTFRLMGHILVLDALAALYLTDTVHPAALVLVAGLTAAAWRPDLFSERLGQLPHFWELFTVGFLIFALADLLFLADSIIAALLHLLLFLVVYRLFHARTPREHLELVLLTFLQLLAASTLTASFGFLLVFCLYVVFAIWAFILWDLTRESELAACPGRATQVMPSGFLLSGGYAAALALALTAILFFFIPRLGQAFLPFRAPLGVQTTGFTDRVELGTYGSIQTDPTVIMRVSFPDDPSALSRLGDLRWRGIALDRFDGHTWSLSRSDVHPVRQAWQGRYLIAPYELGVPFVSAEVFLEPIGTTAVFVPPRVVGIELPLPRLGMDTAGSLSVPIPPAGRIRYQVLSQVAGPNPGRLRTSESPEDLAGLRARYLQLPALRPRVRALAERLAAGAATPSEVIARAATHLERNIRYSLDLGRATGRDPLEEFLFERRTGNCEYFASSLVVLLRAVGIPARLVNGFQRGEWNEVGQYLAVRQRDAHSWAEVYVDGHWLTVDPTPRAAFEERAFGQSGWIALSFDALRWRWNRYVVDYSLLDQASFALRLRQRSMAFQSATGRTLGQWSALLGRGVAALRRHARGLLGGVALVAIVCIALRRWRLDALDWRWVRRARRDHAPVAFYDGMLRLLGRRGYRRSPSTTAREFLGTLIAEPPLHGRAEALTALYERVRFGGQPLSPMEYAHARTTLREIMGLPRGRR
ncbi:MAG TPA: DUF3488 and transglutaminase-like domain-containing protein [Candidatus Baltobacteraceae bacterium]|nr:DUF3488 and transglutaminase-like domain-containing protein [Candidatus Baltobacteraceae bacterium]